MKASSQQKQKNKKKPFKQPSIRVQVSEHLSAGILIVKDGLKIRRKYITEIRK